MDHKIKVAHIITRMDRGGAPDIVRIIFEKLNPSVFELTLFYGPTVEPSQKSKEFLKKLGTRAVLVPFLKRDVNIIDDCRAFFMLRNLLSKAKFDVVHTHTAKAGALGRVAAKLAGVKRVIYSSHGHDFYGYFGRIGSFLVVAAEKLASSFCDKVHVLTQLEKDDFIKFGICKSEKIEVIYSGVELDIYHRKKSSSVSLSSLLEEKKEKDMLIGVVGRLEPIKGVEFLVEAASLIVSSAPKVGFLIVGDGSLRSKLEKRVLELGLSGNFKFIGWRDDVDEVLPLLDMLVLPSLNEAVGRSVLEAQAIGIPVVASRVGGVAEVVKDGVTGILVEPKNVKMLAQAVLRLLQDSSLRQEMGLAAQKWVDEKFSDKAMVEKFSELYKKMAQSINL